MRWQLTGIGRQLRFATVGNLMVMPMASLTRMTSQSWHQAFSQGKPTSSPVPLSQGGRNQSGAATVFGIYRAEQRQRWGDKSACSIHHKSLSWGLAEDMLSKNIHTYPESSCSVERTEIPGFGASERCKGSDGGRAEGFFNIYCPEHPTETPGIPHLESKGTMLKQELL